MRRGLPSGGQHDLVRTFGRAQPARDGAAAQPLLGPAREPGATTIAYDVLTSKKAYDWGIFEAICVQSDGADLVANEASVPLPGQAYYYLVRAEGPCGSNLGTRSDGTPRVGRAARDPLPPGRD